MTTGIVLAGGRSQRFGTRDKLTAMVNGRPLIHYAVSGLSTTVENIIVSCRAEQIPTLKTALKDSSQPIEFIPDHVPVRGPLGGFASALDATTSRRVVVIAGDMPLVTGKLFEKLLSKDEAECTVPLTHDGRLQPLCATYRRIPTKEAADAALEADELSVSAFLERLEVETIEIPTPTDHPGLLYNVNTSSALQQIVDHVSGECV